MTTKILKHSCSAILFITAISFLVIGNFLIIIAAIGQSNLLY